METEALGLAALLVIAIDVWAIVSIAGAIVPFRIKLMWASVVLLVPVGGFIAWMVAGPHQADYRE